MVLSLRIFRRFVNNFFGVPEKPSKSLSESETQAAFSPLPSPSFSFYGQISNQHRKATFRTFRTRLSSEVVGDFVGIKNQCFVRVWDSPRDRLKGGRSKASPTRPSVSCPQCPDRRESLLSGIRSISARDRGGSLKRLHRASRFRFS
jgi:hypothetical protein